MIAFITFFMFVNHVSS